MICTTNVGCTVSTTVVSKETTVSLNPGVQIVSTTILSQSGDWFIETYVSDDNILQRATSVSDPSNIATRISTDAGATWNGWIYSYAVWKV